MATQTHVRNNIRLNSSDEDINKLLDCHCMAIHYPDLTPAELAVTELFVRGKSYIQMANTRNVSPDTIKSQIGALLAKTGMKNRYEILLHVALINIKQCKLVHTSAVDSGTEYPRGYQLEHDQYS